MQRVTHAGENFGAGELLAAHVDLGLVPELDPVVRERFGQADARLGLRGEAELLLGDELLDRGGLERLLEHRQHAQVMLLADVLEVLQYRGAAVAHELHGAGVTQFAQCLDRLDRIIGVQADAEEDKVRRAGRARGAERIAVGEFHRIDPDALQDQRYEMPDAAFFVDDEAERAALKTGRGIGDRRRGGGGRWGRLGLLGHLA